MHQEPAAYQYRGYVILCLPSGGAEVREDAGDGRPGSLVCQLPDGGQGAAMQHIDSVLAV